jgi:proteasome accessory factor B
VRTASSKTGGKAKGAKAKPARAAAKLAKRGKPGSGSGTDPDTGSGKKTADAAARGDRSKRLLDLVMILLRARTPVTYRDIREQFTAFQTAHVEAGLRAFERDKADLLELGVPIRYITPDEDDSLEDGGYVIDLKRFKMPEVRLTADEISALVLAASVAHAMPGGSYPKIVDLALKKLAFDLPELPDTPTEFPRPAYAAPNAPTVLVHFPEQRAAAREALGEIYATLEAATRLRKRVTLTYRTATTGLVSRRDIDPYALVYREGAWLVVGWCHLRHEIRSFRVDRITDCVMAAKPKSPDFERPADFDVKAYATRSPWTFTSEPPEEVQLAFSAEAAEVANEDFGPTAVKRVDRISAPPCAPGAPTGYGGAARSGEAGPIDHAAGSERTLITFDCTNPEFAVSRVLAAKGAIRVLRGERLRARVADELAAVAARYEEAADVP